MSPNAPIACRPPVSLTSLVGRAGELESLGALVAAQRLVTLTGVGGSGKTRLAAELALRIDWQQADRVAWIELGACTEPQAIAQQIATALSIRATQAANPLDAVSDALRDRDLLLVVDNCEHMVAVAAGIVRTLLLRCPKLHVLATSREPLGVAGEHVWPVPPIAPDDALRLFAERAMAVAPEFQLTGETAASVAEICRRLDGIPLAIELAAARVRVLTPAQIAAKLEDCFSILTSGARTADPRHRTLRAAIDWSFDLLSTAEQQLLSRLSVFAGSFSLDSAEKVCGADLDLLSALVDKSLVVTKSRSGAIRYQLLETIRHYAAERLQSMGETEALRRRHAIVFLDLAREAVVDPMADIIARLDGLDAEHDNVRAALAWGLDADPDGIALPLGAAFRWYWYFRIFWGEGRRWLERTLERSSAAASPERARALAAAGTFAAYLGDLATGRARLEEAIAMWRAVGDPRELALTLSAFAQLLGNAGELELARAAAEESVTLVRAAGTQWDVAYCLTNATAFVAQKLGELAAADRALEEAELIWQGCRHPLGLPFVLNARAVLALRRGDPEAAERFARAALEETRRAADRWFTARSLRILACTSAHAPRAARLLGAADAMLRSIGAKPLPHEMKEQDDVMARLREALPGEQLDAALAEGRAMSHDAACDFALDSEPAREDAQLLVRDLGALRIQLDGSLLGGDRRTRELLVFLLAHPPGPTKEEVGVAFWPDATTEQVKNAFHVTLHRLRKLLGSPDAIVADGGRYVVAAPHVAESRQFEASMTAALKSGDPTALESALASYAGDFLQGEEAGEWCLPIRARLRQLHIRGLFALGEACDGRGRWVDAAEAYSRVLARDPFHEAAARKLMVCRARLGARSESLLVYRELEERLRADLETLPEPETRSLYQRLRANEAL